FYTRLLLASPHPHLRFVSALRPSSYRAVFFLHDSATPDIYTLSLHDALPISTTFRPGPAACPPTRRRGRAPRNMTSSCRNGSARDRKSTRLNSSHVSISYAVFCLKKKTVRFCSPPYSISARASAASAFHTPLD